MGAYFASADRVDIVCGIGWHRHMEADFASADIGTDGCKTKCAPYNILGIYLNSLNIFELPTRTPGK